MAKTAGIEGASPHDLRRTARTLLGRLGVPGEVAERYIGHAPTRIEATYHVGDLREERRRAAIALANHLGTLMKF